MGAVVGAIGAGRAESKTEVCGTAGNASVGTTGTGSVSATDAPGATACPASSSAILSDNGVGEIAIVSGSPMVEQCVSSHDAVFMRASVHDVPIGTRRRFWQTSRTSAVPRVGVASVVGSNSPLTIENRDASVPLARSLNARNGQRHVVHAIQLHPFPLTQLPSDIPERWRTLARSTQVANRRQQDAFAAQGQALRCAFIRCSVSWMPPRRLCNRWSSSVRVEVGSASAASRSPERPSGSIRIECVT